MAAMASLTAIASLASTVATVVSVGSTIIGAFTQSKASSYEQQAYQLQANAARQESAARLAIAQANQRTAEFEAAQLDQEAKHERAVAQREALDERRRTNLALSALQARGMGFTSTDPTALNLASEIEDYGSLREQIAQFGGAYRASGAEAAAAGRRHTGAVGVYGAEQGLQAGELAAQGALLSAQGARYNSISTIIGQFGNLASRFASPAYNNFAPKSGFRYD